MDRYVTKQVYNYISLINTVELLVRIDHLKKKHQTRQINFVKNLLTNNFPRRCHLEDRLRSAL